MQDNFIFELQNPIKTQANIEGKNDFIDLELIYCSAPNYKHKDFTINLKKKFMEALLSIAFNGNGEDADDDSANKKDKKLDKQTIKALLYSAKGFDLRAYLRDFEALLKKVAFKDEEKTQPLNNLDFDKLDGDDLENLVIGYIEIFFIVSWTNFLK